MILEKTVLATMTMPYPLGLVRTPAGHSLVTATEDHGPLLLAEPPYRAAVQIAPGPGGSMALIEDRESPGVFWAIMGCFVGYKFHTGALYRVHREAGAWIAARMALLPFAHRLELVRRGGARYVVAATIAADKTDAADWSRPGCVYAAPLSAAPGGELELGSVLEGIHRNHGFLVTSLGGKPTLLITGAEGVLATDLDASDPVWRFRTLLPNEVSEVALLDVDGDGRDELCTIEPFHGGTLRVYRGGDGVWTKHWEGEIEFGHCLLGAVWQGKPCLLVSNRAGSKDLVMLRWKTEREPERLVIDHGVGAANMLVLNDTSTDRIFSTNQATREIAMYTPAGR